MSFLIYGLRVGVSFCLRLRIVKVFLHYYEVAVSSRKTHLWCWCIWRTTSP